MLTTVSLINMESFTIGTIATLRFPIGNVPRVGDIVQLPTGVYRITGVVFSVNTAVGFARLADNIFDCRIAGIAEDPPQPV
ncbi:hypothetical protein [Chitinophaga nivalis]|uniref:Primosomal protein N' 3' DNA-binding domain-containing protein n=1 Tax=Chitinophaga nivalis TaxID=2991709 RepID=A0ABT3IHV9_9BACT|nr:hypothetical protein [Chitinophaga nivalis]MCW3466754.1 hypothetical protein [Chitinophaga nivalis]MCW3483555.1 hypothetical protein [Chitinophaga nivalis]